MASTDQPAYCWATLVTTAKYLQGLLVLQASLKAVGSQYPLIVMVTEQMDQRSRDVIAGRGLEMVQVDSLRPNVDSSGGGARGRAAAAVFERFGDTWTKLRAFGLVDYQRVVLLDCDMLVLRNIDSLMTMPLPSREWIAACHACACNPRKLPTYPSDWVPENCAFTATPHPQALDSPTPASPTSPLTPSFPPSSPRPHALLNSGLVLLHPSHQTMHTIEEYIENDPEVLDFKFPDQDALAVLFQGRWKSLSWVYNALKTLRSCHQTVWVDDEVRNLHYILDKPWQHPRSEAGNDPTGTHEWWWPRYDDVLDEMKQTPGSGWEIVDEWVAK